MPDPTTPASAQPNPQASPPALRSRRTMNFSEAVVISTSSLWAHKLRSVLTLIGVVIGVSAVIAVVSLINGANQYVATRVFRLGEIGRASCRERVEMSGLGGTVARKNVSRRAVYV